jgi:hypothetical protein
MVKQNEPEIFLRVNQIVGDRAKGIPGHHSRIAFVMVVRCKARPLSKTAEIVCENYCMENVGYSNAH